MTSVHPVHPDSDANSDHIDLVVKTPPKVFVVQKDNFVPKGLVPGASMEKLLSTNILKIRPNKTMYKATSANNVPNRYLLLDDSDRQVFTAMETSDVVCRCAFGRKRSYTINILTEKSEIMLGIQKDYSCLSSFGCCSFAPNSYPGHSSTILDDNAQPCGRVLQRFEVVFPFYQVQDSDNTPRFDIISLAVGCCLPFNNPFKKGHVFAIYRPQSPYEIGYIGIEEEGDKNSFLKFPADSILSDRVLLMGALVHLHIMFLTNTCGCQ